MAILIVAGEVSGELYGAMLAKAIRKQHPSVEIYGVGGDELRAASDHFLAETAYAHAVGMAGVFGSWRRTQALCKTLHHACQTVNFEQVVLIDFQHTNFTLATVFAQYKIPITTFITPNFWIWGDQKQAKKIAKYSQKIITIFEKEYQFYKPLHPEVYYFGHPMVDIVNVAKQEVAILAPKKPAATPQLRLGLLPGSRKQEFDLLLYKMLCTAACLKATFPELSVHILISHPRFKSRIMSDVQKFPELNVKLVDSNKTELFRNVDFLLCASGSATLEAILYQVPMGIFCALPPLTYLVAKYILRLQLAQISLPNIMVGRIQVPEWVQDKIHPASIAKEVTALIRHENPQTWAKRYAPIIRSMTPTGSPITKIAEAVMAGATSLPESR